MRATWQFIYIAMNNQLSLKKKGKPIDKIPHMKNVKLPVYD